MLVMIFMMMMIWIKMMMLPYCGVVCEQGEEGGEVKARVFQEESAAFPDHGFDHHQHQETLGAT